MSSLNRTFGRALATLFATAVLLPTTVHAWPFGRMLHLHPANTEKDGRITVQLFYKGNGFEDVRINGQVYTLKPRDVMTLTAAEGTEVYSASDGYGHHRDQLLLKVSPELEGKQVVVR